MITLSLKISQEKDIMQTSFLIMTMPQNYKQFLTAQWIQKRGEWFVVTEGTSGWSQVKLKGLQAGLVQFQSPEYFGFMIQEETEKGPKGTRLFISPPPPTDTHTFSDKGLAGILYPLSKEVPEPSGQHSCFLQNDHSTMRMLGNRHQEGMVTLLPDNSSAPASTSQHLLAKLCLSQ